MTNHPLTAVLPRSVVGFLFNPLTGKVVGQAIIADTQTEAIAIAEAIVQVMKQQLEHRWTEFYPLEGLELRLYENE